ncbi:MAG: GatB/YqeY domain-containing protein [Actinomycetota bacterium]|nr:GatB/YqeY domain-containing protein [Actinomycetota bacterium]
MSTLKDRLRADLTTSMKARNELATATLRMALAAVHTEEVAGKSARELSDDEVMTVLRREVKKRREAAEAFAQGDRPDSAERERAEGMVLEGYLPAQLSDEALAELVREAVAESGATSAQQMGQAMKAVRDKVAGRADGARTAAEVRRQLSTP